MKEEPQAIRDWAAVRQSMGLRDVVQLAIEALGGNALDWIVFHADELRAHVLAFVDDYAQHRGVIMSTADIASELDAVVELRKLAGK